MLYFNHGNKDRYLGRVFVIRRQGPQHSFITHLFGLDPNVDINTPQYTVLLLKFTFDINPSLFTKNPFWRPRYFISNYIHPTQF